MTLADPRTLEVTLGKGYCFILNFKDLSDPLLNRDGSEKDVWACEKTLNQLWAEVHIRSRFITFNQVRAEILALRQIDWTK
jgi:hypothetical protein